MELLLRLLSSPRRDQAPKTSNGCYVTIGFAEGTAWNPPDMAPAAHLGGCLAELETIRGRRASTFRVLAGMELHCVHSLLLGKTEIQRPTQHSVKIMSHPDHLSTNISQVASIGL